MYVYIGSYSQKELLYKFNFSRVTLFFLINLQMPVNSNRRIMRLYMYTEQKKKVSTFVITTIS